MYSYLFVSTRYPNTPGLSVGNGNYYRQLQLVVWLCLAPLPCDQHPGNLSTRPQHLCLAIVVAGLNKFSALNEGQKMKQCLSTIVKGSS